MRASLRTRVMLGALLWTLGLFFVSGVLLNKAILHHPEVPIAYHHIFGHAHGIFLVSLVLMILGFVQVRRGLTPVKQLQERLGAVRDGRESRLGGSYPSEVQPLVDDLNALLDERERRVARAMAKAGDLAHGLKTPLAVISHEARTIDQAGGAGAASAIQQQIDRMRRQIDYHLAQARASAAGTATTDRASIADAVDGIIRTLDRVPRDRVITAGARVDATHTFRGRREDLDEMLGNLIENAYKWGRSRVSVSSRADGDRVAIMVEDDGPGIEPAMRDRVLQRGIRADEAAPGTGLGLAIVRDLAETCGGSVTLGRSPLGGLLATVELPAAHRDTTGA